jgi:dihydroorotase
MIIKGGNVLLAQGFAERDLAVADGRIAKIAVDIAAEPGEEVIDATGCLVTPGLIDLHVHAFKHGHHVSIDVDEVAPRTGVTTFVDAGSVGAIQFPAFRKFVMDESEVNLFAYLNVSVLGQTTSGFKGLNFHDNDSRELIHLPLAEEIIEKHRDLIKGIKVRVYTGMSDLYALEQARILADRTKLPIMVHLGPSPPAAAGTLALLESGDMFTHPYHGGDDTILDANGRIRPEFRDARSRGVEVDLGMDRFHCDLTIMKRCFDQGFFPDYVSTDLTLINRDSITFDLPTTISKCVAMGMPLEQALAAAGKSVADKLDVPGISGRIEPGHTADLAVFRWQQLDDPLIDFFGNKITDPLGLQCMATILRGRRLAAEKKSELALLDNSIRAVPWASYGYDPK